MILTRISLAIPVCAVECSPQELSAKAAPSPGWFISRISVRPPQLGHLAAWLPGCCHTVPSDVAPVSPGGGLVSRGLRYGTSDLGLSHELAFGSVEK